MSQSKALVEVIKKELKSRGLTYLDVAAALELSEASVKRMFAEANFSLRRLDKLCHFLQVDLVELTQSLAVDRDKIIELSEEQERAIAADGLTVLVAICALNGYRFEDIKTEYGFDDAELIQILAKLDRMKFIELLPQNRIKLLVSRHFSWRADGPIQRYFLNNIVQDFYSSRFNLKEEKLLVTNGCLTAEKNKVLQEKMQLLVREFTELTKEDIKISPKEKSGQTLLIAVRKWNSGAINPFSRR